MSISVADNFSYQGAKPLDARFQFSSVANMKAAAEASLYNGCLAYVTATKKYYSYDSSNSVDTTTGRWREYQSGSGEDAKAYHTDDTAETTLADADYFPFYDSSATAKKKTLWSNIKSSLKTYFDTLYNKYSLPTATDSVLGGVKIGENMTITDGVINPSYTIVANKFNKSDIYSTTEKVIGCWTDGRPIYQKLISYLMPEVTTDGVRVVGSPVSIGASIQECVGIKGLLRIGTTTDTSNFIEYNNRFVRAVVSNNTASSNKNTLIVTSSAQQFNNQVCYFIIQYTKTTDASNSFKYADENDYSTNEKIVGTWIDDKLIYQRTYSIGALPNATYKDTSTGLSNITCIKVWGWTYHSSGVMLPITSGYPDGSSSIAVSVRGNGSTIRVITGTDRTTWTPTYVTIQYTKN